MTDLPPKLDTLLTPIITVAQQVAKLQGTVDVGFAGINEHLKTLNGQVLDHSKIISKILADEQVKIGVRKGVRVSWGFAVTVATLITGFISAIVYFKK